MISVIIPTFNHARLLPRTLAPLVDGVAHGIVRQVICADGGSGDGTTDIADAAGCDLVTSEGGRGKQIRAAVPGAKGKYLFILDPGAELRAGWIEAAEAFCATLQSRIKAAAFQLAFDDASPQAQRALFWARLRARVTNLPYSEQGVIMSRFFYDGLGGYPDLPRLSEIEFARRIGVKRWIYLEAEAQVSFAAFCQTHRLSAKQQLTMMAQQLMGADPVELAKTYERGSRDAVRASNGV